MFYSLTRVSMNQKTGPIPVSTSAMTTCPISCAMREACYAKSGPLLIHWNKVTTGERGMDIDGFCAVVKTLPKGQLWRHNQAGDLPGDGDTLDLVGLAKLVEANRGRRGYTYTHKPLNTEAEREAIREANQNGFTISLSANTLEHADTLTNLGIAPVVVVLPEDVQGKQTVTTPGGNKVVVCPATYRDDVNCASCKLCAVRDRKVIVGFPVHGNQKRKYLKVLA